jgi:hypothetical protein
MIYTVKPSYNDISLYGTLYIASNIMSYQLIPNIVILLIRTPLVYNSTNYAVPFVTLQPSSTCVCVCVCVRACVRARVRAYVRACATHMHLYVIICCIHIYTHTLLSVMS